MKKKAPSSAMVTVELLYYKLCNASHARPALVPTQVLDARLGYMQVGRWLDAAGREQRRWLYMAGHAKDGNQPALFAHQAHDHDFD